MPRLLFSFALFLVLLLVLSDTGRAQTVALWLFDEQQELYPSSVLNDASGHERVMILGMGGRIVSGRFGNALAPSEEHPRVQLPDPDAELPSGAELFGLVQLPISQGRTVEPLSWYTADFAALMTAGEAHLRKEVELPNPTATGLNLGGGDWTVEFWLRTDARTTGEGTVYEVGTGPRGESGTVTRLTLDGTAFRLVNRPGGADASDTDARGTDARIPSDAAALGSGGWHHYAFVHDAAAGVLRHFVDGEPFGEAVPVVLEALPVGEEAYLSVGRDGAWGRPLAGALDELRVSAGAVYAGAFEPQSFAEEREPYTLAAGPPLLYPSDEVYEVPAGTVDYKTGGVVELGDRKHLFIDDALVAEREAVEFVVNPPRLAEKVVDEPHSPKRKHLTVIEDEDGLLRIYAGVADDYLGVWTSRDGVHWEMPDTGQEHEGWRNVAIAQPTATGTVFIDPNAPPEERWKYVGGYDNEAIYVYSSPDGWNFRKHTTAIMPFRVASQVNIFYDEQRQAYAGYWRTGFPAFPSGDTRREWLFAESKDLMTPWPFDPVTQEETWAAAETRLLRPVQPWWLDNGPLTPGGFGIEFPTVFGHLDDFDAVSADVYVPKAIKYPWALDTYLAFPLLYFHWDGDGPPTRLTLGEEWRGMGSGPVETQLSVSRDGTRWQRYPRPAYVGIGRHAGDDVKQAYMANGLVRRGDEIWQYYFGTNEYHSNYRDEDEYQAIYRTVQRLDGFVSADTPYDRLGSLTTHPLRFTGDRLTLNVDTDAAGYLQVGLLDADGREIPGFGLDDCVYVNGDFVSKEVEWLRPDGSASSDVSALAGRAVRLVFRSRGTKLYAFQFTHSDGAKP